MTQRFVLGILGGPFGLKGHLKFRPWSGENAHILRLKTVILMPPNREHTPGGRPVSDGPAGEGEAGRRYTVEEAAPSGPGVLLKFQGIDSPEAAKNLSGYRLVVDRADAARLGPGEYYVEDLRGLAVAALREGGPAAPDDPGLEILGRVTDIIEGGGGLLLEMRPGGGDATFWPVQDGGKRGGAGKGGEPARLIPFRNEFFGEISMERGVIVLLHRWILA